MLWRTRRQNTQSGGSLWYSNLLPSNLRIFIREYDVGPTVLQKLLMLNSGRHNSKIVVEHWAIYLFAYIYIFNHYLTSMAVLVLHIFFIITITTRRVFIYLTYFYICLTFIVSYCLLLPAVCLFWNTGTGLSLPLFTTTRIPEMLGRFLNLNKMKTKKMSNHMSQYFIHNRT